MAPRQTSRSLLVVDRFAPEAKALRKVIDDRFKDPRRLHPDRFRWDLWNVPDQYTLLRTPAWEYFPEDLYTRFHTRLVLWGRRVLGCHDISPPWLSAYVNGCEQALHGDLPHGPFAFVFSLTKWDQRVFRGGETVMLKDSVLDYWNDFRSVRSVEGAALTTRIEPKFSRLVVFDPRVPHGVRRVSGTMDPSEGRIVVHGWFVNPRPFIEGPLPPKRAQELIGEVSNAVAPWIGAGLRVAGVLSYRFTVGADGRPRNLRLLANTTRVPREESRAQRALIADIERTVRDHRFPRAKSVSTMTLPIVFERD
jgi:hypothetical protein